MDLIFLASLTVQVWVPFFLYQDSHLIKNEPSMHTYMNIHMCVCNLNADQLAWQIGPPSPQSFPDAFLILPEYPGMPEKEVAEKNKMRCE